MAIRPQPARFEAIAATPARLNLASRRRSMRRAVLWIQAAVIDWLNSPRRPSESYTMLISGNAYLVVARLVFERSPVSVARDTAQGIVAHLI